MLPLWNVNWRNIVWLIAGWRCELLSPWKCKDIALTQPDHSTATNSSTTANGAKEPTRFYRSKLYWCSAVLIIQLLKLKLKLLEIIRHWDTLTGISLGEKCWQLISQWGMIKQKCPWWVVTQMSLNFIAAKILHWLSSAFLCCCIGNL